jgi:hypothetical protein
MGHGGAFDTKRFPGAEETSERLERAGFVDVRCWLTDEPTILSPTTSSRTSPRCASEV